MHRDEGAGAAAAPAGVDAHAAGDLRLGRPGDERGVGDHRGGPGAGGAGDDGRRDAEGAGGVEHGLPAGRRRRAADRGRGAGGSGGGRRGEGAQRSAANAAPARCARRWTRRSARSCGPAARARSARSGRSRRTTTCWTASCRAPSLPETMQGVARVSKEYGFAIANVFHAGDGNLHPCILFDERKRGRDDARAGRRRGDHARCASKPAAR